jgi:hypothetical protein
VESGRTRLLEPLVETCQALWKPTVGRHAEGMEYSMAGVALVQQAIDAVIDEALEAGRVVGAVVLPDCPPVVDAVVEVERRRVANEDERWQLRLELRLASAHLAGRRTHVLRCASRSGPRCHRCYVHDRNGRERCETRPQLIDDRGEPCGRPEAHYSYRS